MNPLFKLMRFDKPIGVLLLLWPTLWALWIASGGIPDSTILFVFIAGVVVMRAGGCVINDFADKDFDGHVERTKNRPLVTGHVNHKQALLLFCGLMFVALCLALFLNKLTLMLAVVGFLIASSYPFFKRYTHLPQLILGLAFAWPIPMAFAAVQHQLPIIAWYLFTITFLWTVAYDTLYAMVDRDFDVKIGLKSTAILFAEYDRMIIAVLQALVLGLLVLLGVVLSLSYVYFIALILGCGLFCYQQWLIKERDPKNCFKAFLNNHWFGMVVFLGIMFTLLPGSVTSLEPTERSHLVLGSQTAQ